VRRAVDIFSTIHSIDRLKVARAIDRVAGELGLVRRGLLEVNLAAEGSKHGFAPAALDSESLEQLAALEHLEIVGLMAIPPFGESPEASRPWFRRLREVRDGISDRDLLPRWRGDLSMGMSQDFEVAIEEGATFVRVGSDLFGPRAAGEGDA
jgi:pyridoxal phosphate enzyme (YggS family)